MRITGGALAGAQLRTREGAGERMPVEVAATTFEDLFRSRYEPMVRVAFLLVGSRAEAEDVVQDAFARIELRWARLDNAEGYLRRCVVNRRASFETHLGRLLATGGASEKVQVLGHPAVLVEHPDGGRWSLLWRQTDDATVVASFSGADRSTVEDFMGGLDEISEGEWQDLVATHPAPATTQSTVPAP